jgi:hypothetical protein
MRTAKEVTVADAVATDEGLEALRERWPGWHIRQSGGAWKATRLGESLTWDQIALGHAETLIADTRADLERLLEVQAGIGAGA